MEVTKATSFVASALKSPDRSVNPLDPPAALGSISVKTVAPPPIRSKEILPFAPVFAEPKASGACPEAVTLFKTIAVSAVGIVLKM